MGKTRCAVGRRVECGRRVEGERTGGGLVEDGVWSVRIDRRQDGRRAQSMALELALDGCRD